MTEETALSKDNIILITTDQQRFDTIQALGNGSIFTPHLNYMVNEGIAFTRCYADCPVCIPSRTTIMTGLKGYESGILSNQSHAHLMMEKTIKKETLPALLTQHGFQTKAVGKMHFEPARANYGFEDMELAIDYMRHYDKMQNRAKPKAHGLGECLIEPVISTVHENDSITHWITERSIDFIETRDTTRPFFMWTSFTKPHPPFDPPMNYWSLYEHIEMPEPVYGDWSDSLEETPQGFLAGTYENTNMHMQSPDQIKAIRRAYYAMITQVDYSLGRLFASLREQGLLENTWILFTADHGEMLGDHHAAQKNLFFEGSAHVPMLILPPSGRLKDKRNHREERLTQMCDIYPTIMTIAGIDIKAMGLSGVNLLELSDQPVERTFYGNTMNVHYCIMDNEMKLIYSRQGNHYLLFDMKSDPMEKRDLSRNPAFTSVLKRMKAMLIDQIIENSPDLVDGDGSIITIPEPEEPGDVGHRWFGFHYKDYSLDVFH